MSHSPQNLTATQRSYIDMLERYEIARSKGMEGKYFIQHTLVPETGKTYQTVQKDIQRGRKLRDQIEVKKESIVAA